MNHQLYMGLFSRLKFINTISEIKFQGYWYTVPGREGPNLASMYNSIYEMPCFALEKYGNANF